MGDAGVPGTTLPLLLGQEQVRIDLAEESVEEGGVGRPCGLAGIMQGVLAMSAETAPLAHAHDAWIVVRWFGRHRKPLLQPGLSRVGLLEGTGAMESNPSDRGSRNDSASASRADRSRSASAPAVP